MVSSSPVIAIVDDDPGMRGSLDSLLRSVGLRSQRFASAEALLADDAGERPSCIVTDIHMPGMSGLELQREIARRGWAQPVIVMTAFPQDEARAEAIAAGACAFLVKPIDPDCFLDAVSAALSGNAGEPEGPDAR